MAKCVRCGREIPTGEIFCESCASKPLPDAGTSSASGRHLKKKKKTAKAAKAPKGGRAGLIIALVLAILVALAALGACLYLYETTSHERANLRGHLSVLALTEATVTLTGLNYNLPPTRLTPTFPLGVSNAFVGREAAIEVSGGTVLLIEENE